MAKGDDIKAKDTVSRYVPGSKVSHGRPLKEAYVLSDNDRKNKSPHLSVNWLEFFADRNKQEQIDEVRAIINKKLNIRKSASLALLNIKSIHDKLRQHSVKVRILHWPDLTERYEDESHSGIFDVEKDPDLIALALSQINCEVVPARKPGEQA